MLTPDTLTGDVVDRNNPAYPAARMDFNQRLQFYPRYVVFCESVHDVQTAVRWARAHGVRLRPRCGRHSYEDFSVLDGGLVVDVSRLNAVELDAAAGTARIGAGANLGQVYDGLWNQGRVTIPGGGCTGVGISGLVLGAGFGLLTRLYGLTCDSLLGLELVDAEGRVLQVSDQDNADLMWASRGGGGGNFGIATAFRFRVQPIDYVTAFSISWRWRDLRTVLGAFQTWADPERLDHRVSPILVLPAESAGAVTVLGELVGPFAELDALVQPLVQAAKPLDMAIVHETYIEAVHRFTGAAAGAERWAVERAADPALNKFKNTSAYAPGPLPRAAVDMLVAQLQRAPSPNDLVQINLHGGAETRLGNDATAYPWRRGIRYSLQYQAYWSQEAEGPAQQRWVEGFRRAMLPWTVGAYVNYVDLDIADWPQAYYAGNLPRLLQVKQRYDPDNVFDFPQGLGRAGRPGRR